MKLLIKGNVGNLGKDFLKNKIVIMKLKELIKYVTVWKKVNIPSENYKKILYAKEFAWKIKGTYIRLSENQRQEVEWCISFRNMNLYISALGMGYNFISEKIENFSEFDEIRRSYYYFRNIFECLEIIENLNIEQVNNVLKEEGLKQDRFAIENHQVFI